jgi:penicillin-binding protein 1C
MLGEAKKAAEQVAAPHPRLDPACARSAYTLSPSKRGEGKFAFNFDVFQRGWRQVRPLPVRLRGEGRGQHGGQPGRPRVRGGGLLRFVAATCAIIAISLFAIARVAIHVVEPAPIAAAEAVSVTVLDRQDRLLRAFTTSGGRWRLPIEPGDVDARYIRLLTAFEDRRFYSHGGVDPRGLTRATLQFVRHGRIISGGSTLTMQVARLLVGEHERTGTGKLRQIVRAWQLERTLSKQEILRLYLRMAPFGGNIEGVRAASLTYFGREPRRLSVGEAALLVALPQAPEVRRPDRFPEAAKRARARVLAQGVKQGVITAAEAARANAERMPTARQDFPKFAPHLAEAEMAAHSETSVHRLTLDRELQAQLEVLARDQTRALGNRLSAAIIVADHKTGEVLAHVGSSDYFDDTRFGSVDMVRAARSPGSTLKPFIYGLAFEAGLAHPETLIEDRPVRFGTYTPKNFDEDFHGTVSIREALAQSLNIPAVKVLNAVGPGKLLGRFRRAGIVATLPKDSHEPTLAIALGGVGLRLVDLAGLYAGLARGGDVIELRHLRGQAPKPAGLRRQLMTPVAASFVTDILKDAPPPVAAKGGRIAYKTGTSYGYRDAWAVGYDGQHVIAVWVGRPDSTATPGLTGRTAAAPLLFDAFHRLSAERVALTQASGARVSGAALPPPLKRFQEPGETVTEPTGPYLDANVQIAFPPDRAELELEDADDTIQLKADGGVLPLTWLADGTPLAVDGQQRQIQWTPPGRGFVKLSVIDAKGRVDRVTVRVR